MKDHSRTAKQWNSFPSNCFLLVVKIHVDKYDLTTLKRRVNAHLRSV